LKSFSADLNEQAAQDRSAESILSERQVFTISAPKRSFRKRPTSSVPLGADDAARGFVSDDTAVAVAPITGMSCAAGDVRRVCAGVEAHSN